MPNTYNDHIQEKGYSTNKTILKLNQNYKDFIKK